MARDAYPVPQRLVPMRMPAPPLPATGPGHPRGTRLAVVAAALAWTAAAPATGSEPALQLHYQERPPYSYTGADGRPQGLLVTPVERARAKAGVAFVWVRTPSQRQLVLIQDGSGPDCGIGWFRNPQREALGRFSAPIYQDRPFMALARKDLAWNPRQPLPARLADATQLLLVKDGYSYGPAIDRLLARSAGAVRRTSAENVQMARMVEAGRAAWMLVAPEEADALLEELGATGTALQLQPLAGAPPGQTRHLYCNASLPPALIERVDGALVER